MVPKSLTIFLKLKWWCEDWSINAFNIKLGSYDCELWIWKDHNYNEIQKRTWPSDHIYWV